ncbi:glutamine synthetase [Rhizobium sp. R72]|uniref:DUF2735 domain-containing protein n=1 Tax=unclassified Rhizobium TaxID=2613769 RepID=UPI000B52A614|nr:MULTISPECIES: DUF2735 domain-containing protein [unclassified Rhizobium]OWW04766.1 glutamine synthetase [Rhizobium sp. R72]OWW05823.1 glutamine synthetase [Rhizobium sp. R711]
MAIGVNHETATVYAFPAKRFSTTERRPAVDIERDLIPSVYESCWYHDEAINETAEPTLPKFTPRVVD